MAKIKLTEGQTYVIREMAHGAWLDGNVVQLYWLAWPDKRPPLRVAASTVNGLVKRGLLQRGRNPITERGGYYATPEAIAAMWEAAN